MHTTKLRTFPCNSRSAKLTHTIILGTDKLIAPDFMHLITHRLCHAFPAEQTDMDLQILRRINSPVTQFFS